MKFSLAQIALLAASVCGTASAYPAWYVEDGPAVHYKQYHRLLSGTFNAGGTAGVQNCGTSLVPTAGNNGCQAVAGYYLSGNSASTTNGATVPVTCAGATNFICPQGTYGTALTTAGLTGEVTCGANMVANSAATACVAAKGFYAANDVTGNAAGTACPAGFITSGIGALTVAGCTVKCDISTPTGCLGDYTFSGTATTGCYYGNYATLTGGAWVSGTSTCTDCAAGSVSPGWTTGATAASSACITTNVDVSSVTCGANNAITIVFTGGEEQANTTMTANDLTAATDEVLSNVLYTGTATASSCTASTTLNGVFTCTGFTADTGYECPSGATVPVGSLTGSVATFTCAAIGGSVNAAFPNGNYPTGAQVSSADITIVNAYVEPASVASGTFTAAASGTSAASTCVVSALNTVTCYGYKPAAGYSCTAANAAPSLLPTAIANPVAQIQTSLALVGMTVAAFDTAAVRSSFISTVAATVNVSTADVAITSVTAYTASGRHLLQASSGVNVAMTVNSASATQTTALTTKLATIATASGASAFVSALQVSNPAFSAVQSLTVTQAPVVPTSASFYLGSNALMVMAVAFAATL